MVTHKLIEAWRQCSTDNPPYYLRTDAVLLAEDLCYLPVSFEEYVQSKHFGQANDTKFHLGLIPLPYVGNLETAKIFLLMLNPGFHPGDYFNDITHHQALSLLSQKLACLELIPYHSKSFGISRKAYNKLQSHKLMLAFVHDVLQVQAKAGDICIIVTRKSKVWGLSKDENIIVYEGHEARAAHLTKNTQSLIMKHLYPKVH